MGIEPDHQMAARGESAALDRWARENTSDTRGTAATRLLNADLSSRQIAVLIGWSVRYAAQVIEHYAQVSPDESGVVLRKLNRAKSKSENTKM